MSLWHRLLLIILACAVMAAIGAVMGVAVSVGGLGVLGLIVLAIATLIGVSLLYRWRRFAAVRAFQAAHPGKDLVVVYTDSPRWLSHIEENWLPRWPDRIVALNRSRPWSATQPEARLWRLFGGASEHTPLAIVVPNHGHPEVIRFWLAFRDFKVGRVHSLQRAEARLATIMQASRP